MKPPNSHEEIPLYRSGNLVSSYLGSFGSGLRETRLTAAVGYIISLTPKTFSEFLGLKGLVLSASLEKYDEGDRADIVIRTTHGTAVIEAKTDVTDPTAQSLRYNANQRILLTNHHPMASQRRRRNFRYINWGQIAEMLGRLSKSKNKAVSFCSIELLRHLEEHNMITKKDPIEIYAREINEQITLNLFLKGQLYGCDYKKDSRLSEAQYFAPHFGEWIATFFPGVEAGISYLAKIETIVVVEDWKELLHVIKDRNGSPYLRRHKLQLDGIHKAWDWGKNQRYFLFLGKPRLAFNPPIKKSYLQAGRGFLSKNYFTFDQLYQAWGQQKIYGSSD